MDLGWKHDELLLTLFDWYANQQSEQALEIVDIVLSENGTRQDFEALISLLTDLNEVSNKAEIIESIKFSIFSRSLVWIWHYLFERIIYTQFSDIRKLNIEDYF